MGFLSAEICNDGKSMGAGAFGNKITAEHKPIWGEKVKKTDVTKWLQESTILTAGTQFWCFKTPPLPTLSL